MRRECRERFPRHRLERKPLVSDHGMHHGTCVTHVSWCMSGPLTRGSGENVPSIPGASTTRKFTYLVRVLCTWKCVYGQQCAREYIKQGIFKQFAEILHLVYQFYLWITTLPYCDELKVMSGLGHENNGMRCMSSYSYEYSYDHSNI